MAGTHGRARCVYTARPFASLPRGATHLNLLSMKTGALAIRRATPDDAGAIADVHDQAWRSAYRGILPGTELERMIARRGPAWWERAVRRRVPILVLDPGTDDGPAGYVTFGQSRARTLPFRGEIYELYLKPEYQGLGFGRELFGAAKEELAARGRRSLVVWALADNEPAFYMRLGGRPVGRSVDRIGEALLPKVAFGWAAARG